MAVLKGYTYIITSITVSPRYTSDNVCLTVNTTIVLLED
jgi:hypothetical protein